ncbi:MAG: exodeoxyribonuclease VII large subunit [Candidatus Krumholzibacteria bacterium]|nr:exodeoxyribonuclease VII large subunit [Candidatus Krumholzibacteria bacterium]
MTERRPDGHEQIGFDDIYTVTEMTEAIRQSLESEFPGVTVMGEIIDFKAHTSGHLYFSLRDASSRLRVVVFSRYARSIRFAPQNGMTILAAGRISHYGGGGATQLVAVDLQIAGRGELDLKVRRILQKLREDGLTDTARKRPLPKYPETIAVITSPTGAARRDIMRTLARRWPIARLVHLPATVQGAEAPASILDAFDRLRDQPGIDCVILARGGGSAEDLDAFNIEAVARAVAASPCPVVTGIGHEVDTTVCDYVADLRAATPTAAAELAAPDAAEVRAALDDSSRRIRAGATASSARRLSAVEILLRSAGFRRLERRIDYERMRCIGVADRLADWWRGTRGRIGGEIDLFPRRAGTALRERWHREHGRWTAASASISGAGLTGAVETRRRTVQGALQLLRARIGARIPAERSRLDGMSRTLKGLGPLEVLERGYALCTSGDGTKIIGSAAEIESGDGLSVRFHDGTAGCRVDTVRKEDAWRRKRTSRRR